MVREQQWFIEAVNHFNSSLIAIERTYLSHLRLAVVLALLSASILLNTRLPDPDADGDSTVSDSQLHGLTFGSLFFVASLAALFGGMINYDKLWSGMKSGKAFVQSPKSEFLSFTKLQCAGTNEIHPFDHRSHTIMLTLVSGLVFATVIVLLVRENVAS